MDKKESRLSLVLDDEEIEAFAKAEIMQPFASLKSSRRMMMRYAILNLPNLLEIQTETLTKEDIKEVIELLHGLAAVMAARPVGMQGDRRGPKINKPAKMTDEEKEEEGFTICTILEGTVDGKSCRYSRYEVLPTGRAVKYELTDPLVSLSQADVTNQYQPTRASWEAAAARDAS